MKQRKERLEKLDKLIEEAKSREEFTQQSALAARFVDLLEQTGTDALIILEKGEDCSALGSGITRRTLFAFLADLFGSEPGLFEEFLDAWDFLRRCESEQDEWAATIH
jgi:hypothetical protein